MSALLSLRGVTAFYGASQALFGIDLAVNEGELVALMGRNGMGKTTTIRAICRLMPHAMGTIVFAGHDLTHLPSHRAGRMGLGLVPEGRRCFANLTVAENLLAAARTTPWSQEWDIAAVARLFPRLQERLSQSASTLSGGEQQMLAIGRALMTNPRLLILDEATEGLAPVVRAEIWAAIAALKSTGLAILAVDKSLRELTAVADQCTLIERGRTVWQGTPGDLSGDITARYLGV